MMSLLCSAALTSWHDTHGDCDARAGLGRRQLEVAWLRQTCLSAASALLRKLHVTLDHQCPCTLTVCLEHADSTRHVGMRPLAGSAPPRAGVSRAKVGSLGCSAEGSGTSSGGGGSLPGGSAGWPSRRARPNSPGGHRCAACSMGRQGFTVYKQAGSAGWPLEARPLSFSPGVLRAARGES